MLFEQFFFCFTAPRITLATAQINWDTMSAQDIVNLERAVGYVYPIHTRFQEHVVRFYGCRVAAPQKPKPNVTYEEVEDIFIEEIPDTPSPRPKPKPTAHIRLRPVETYIPKDTIELFVNSEINNKQEPIDTQQELVIIRKPDVPEPRPTKIIRVLRTQEVSRRPVSKYSGKIMFAKKSRGLIVLCAKNSALWVPRICVVGKRKCKAEDFVNGYLSKHFRSDWCFY